MNKFLKVVITLLIIFVIAEGAIIGYDIYQKQMNNKKEEDSNSKIEKNIDQDKEKDKELDNKEKEKILIKVVNLSSIKMKKNMIR